MNNTENIRFCLAVNTTKVKNLEQSKNRVWCANNNEEENEKDIERRRESCRNENRERKPNDTCTCSGGREREREDSNNNNHKTLLSVPMGCTLRHQSN